MAGKPFRMWKAENFRALLQNTLRCCLMCIVTVSDKYKSRNKNGHKSRSIGGTNTNTRNINNTEERNSSNLETGHWALGTHRFLTNLFAIS